MSSHRTAATSWGWTVTTGSGGDIGFSFQVAGLGGGQALTATATNLASGGTSEFSLDRTVVPGP